MKRIIAICGAMCALASQGFAAERTENVYERMAARESEPHFKERMAESAQRLEEFAWMLGEWRTTITVFATKSTPASTTEENTTFRKFGDTLIADERLSTIMGYDPFVGRWLLAGFELPAVPLTHAYSDWNGRRMTVELPVRIGGEVFRIRQTFSRLGADEFELFNEQLLADGKFHPVDRYRYRRAAAPAH